MNYSRAIVHINNKKLSLSISFQRNCRVSVLPYRKDIKTDQKQMENKLEKKRMKVKTIHKTTIK